MAAVGDMRPKGLEPVRIVIAGLRGDAQWSGHHDRLTLTPWTPECTGVCCYRALQMIA
jgi:hypothetical protein